MCNDKCVIHSRTFDHIGQWVHRRDNAHQHMLHSFSAGNKINLHLAISFSREILVVPKKYGLARELEKLLFATDRCNLLYNAKLEILTQIRQLQVSIGGCGFFYVNRSFLAIVSSSLIVAIIVSYFTLYSYLPSQILSTSCTYLMIVLQMDNLLKPNKPAF